MNRRVSAATLLTVFIYAHFLLLKPQPIGALDDLDLLQQQAVQLYRRGDYAGAILLYQRLSALQPKDSSVLQDYMWVLWSGEQYDKASQVARKIISIPGSKKHLEAWELIARSQIMAGKKRHAENTVRKILSLKSHDWHYRRTAARLYIAMKNYAAAQNLLVRAHRRFPKEPEVYAELAQVQYLRKRYKESVATWAKAVEAAPERGDFKFEQAKALYMAGEIPQAMAIFGKLLEDPSEKRKALDFLTDDAIARKDMLYTVSLMAGNLNHAIPGDEPRLLRLAQAYFELERPRKALPVLRRVLELDPGNEKALLLKADCLRQIGRFSGAESIDRAILRKNPWNWRALSGLADAQRGQGFHLGALKTLEVIRQLDPTDPYLLLSQARYEYEAGKKDQAKQRLTQWMNSNSNFAVPVILYHGLSESERDPMLAHTIHRPARSFEEDVWALQKAGFTPVTAKQVSDFYHKKTPLPEKPILITFDDGRLDSFVNADPILKRYGMKATMYVCAVNVDRNLPDYATWNQIRRYQQTGRWEIQSHGDLAHKKVPTDKEGRMGLYLCNKLWLLPHNRMETPPEWEARVRQDHLRSIDKIRQSVGVTPVSFAFPEGDFGQQGYSNHAAAAVDNLRLAKEAFRISFHEDSYGLNPPSRDPTLLARLDPPPDWSGEDLVRHISDRTPFAQMQRQMLRWSLREGKLRQAHQWLKALRYGGASEEGVQTEKAIILSTLGDQRLAHGLKQQSPSSSPSHRDESLVRVGEKDRLRWNPSLAFTKESKGRQQFRFEQVLALPMLGRSQWNLVHSHAAFREAGVSSIDEETIGAQWEQSLHMYHKLFLEARQHFLSDGLKDPATFTARLNSSLNDELSSVFEVRRSLVQTARGLQAHIKEDLVGGKLIWKPNSLWTASGELQASEFSDGNSRYGVRLQGERLLDQVPVTGLTWLLRSDFETFSDQRLEYYSPEGLKMFQTGFRVPIPVKDAFIFNLEYLIGYADEQGADPHPAHSLGLTVPVTLWKNTSLELGAGWSETPTYTRKSVTVSARHVF